MNGVLWLGYMSSEVIQTLSSVTNSYGHSSLLSLWRSRRSLLIERRFDLGIKMNGCVIIIPTRPS